MSMRARWRPLLRWRARFCSRGGHLLNFFAGLVCLPFARCAPFVGPEPCISTMDRNRCSCSTRSRGESPWHGPAPKAGLGRLGPLSLADASRWRSNAASQIPASASNWCFFVEDGFASGLGPEAIWRSAWGRPSPLAGTSKSRTDRASRRRRSCVKAVPRPGRGRRRSTTSSGTATRSVRGAGRRVPPQPSSRGPVTDLRRPLD